MKKKNPKNMNRRQFIRRFTTAAAGIAAFPSIVPASVLGGKGVIPPSDKIVMAGIGFGMQGPSNMQNFLEKNDVQWVAVCDLDDNHLAEARNTVNTHYGNKSCVAYKDYRELCTRTDLDAVSIAIPDHWHALVSIHCLQTGLDIFGEKPLTHSLREGRALVDTVHRYNRIWQTGSWQRSVANFHKAAELVYAGRIGKIKKIEVGLPSGHYDFAGTKGQETMGPPPAHLDYEFWLGPAPWAPYCPARVHMNWRWNMDYGGGQLMDWIGHHLDIAHWGMGWDDTGPADIEGYGEYSRAGVWNSPTRYYLTAHYADETPVIIAGGFDEIKMGTKWIGEHGWIHVNRGEFTTYPDYLKQETLGPGDRRLYKSRDHFQNFLDCVRTRKPTITPAETAHRSASVGHLGVAAIKLGRKIEWNPVTETIVNDPEASRLLSRSYRSPWQLQS